MTDSLTLLQINYLDTVTEGVDVSRQELGSAGSKHYRWTITFLDEGDDFHLEWSDNQLSTTVDGIQDGTTADIFITPTKVWCVC